MRLRIGVCIGIVVHISIDVSVNVVVQICILVERGIVKGILRIYQCGIGIGSEVFCSWSIVCLRAAGGANDITDNYTRDVGICRISRIDVCVQVGVGASKVSESLHA